MAQRTKNNLRRNRVTQSSAEKKTEDWMQTKWRPLMAITYMATIWFDFIVGPVIFNILQLRNDGQAITSWIPLTLQGGGLYHVAMGAILGIAAWTRGQEKVAVINNTTELVPTAQPQWVEDQRRNQYYDNAPNYAAYEPTYYEDNDFRPRWLEVSPDPVDTGRPLRRKKK